MPKLFLIVLVTFLSAAAEAGAQTAQELADKYPHHEVYEVQPGVQMAAKFAADGLVCEMKIEQTHFVKDGVDLRSGIDDREVDGLIDRLVPKSERGEKDNTPGKNMVLGWGQGVDRMQSYSNVTILVSSSHGTIVVTVNWPHRTCKR